MMYNFQRLIRKYGVKGATTVELTEIKGHYEDGEWVKPSKSEVETALICAIVSMSTKAVNDSAGRYTTNDRQLYTQQQLQDKQTVKYRDITYSVDSQNDYTEYGDFFVYTIKAVSTFATTNTD